MQYHLGLDDETQPVQYTPSLLPFWQYRLAILVTINHKEAGSKWSSITFQQSQIENTFDFNFKERDVVCE